MYEPIPNIHPTKPLTDPGGEPVDIDVEMVPLVRALWSLGLRTSSCCQDFGEGTEGQRNIKPDAASTYGGDAFIEYYRGYAWLKMPVLDATRLANGLLETPFRNRIILRWSPGSWRMHVPLIYGDDQEIITDSTAQIHFPRHQIAQLTGTLGSLAEL